MSTGGQLLSPTLAAYIAVIATILIGIYFTRDDKHNYENIVQNVVSFAVLLATITFTPLTLIFMIIYLLVGILITVKKMRNWFFIFGSKSYGSVALIMLLASEGRFGLYLPWTYKDPMCLYLIIYALIIAGVAHLVHWLHFRKSGSKSRSRARSTSGSAGLKAFFSNKGSSGKKGRGGWGGGGSMKRGWAWFMGK